MKPMVISLVIGKKKLLWCHCTNYQKICYTSDIHCVLMEPDKYTAKKYTCVILSRLLLFLSLTIKVMQWEPRDSSGTYQGKAVGGGGPSLDCGQRPGLQDLKPHRTFVQRE